LTQQEYDYAENNVRRARQARAYLGHMGEQLPMDRFDQMMKEGQ